MRMSPTLHLSPAEKTYPTRYQPDRACLAACLAEAARGTEWRTILVFLFVHVAYLVYPSEQIKQHALFDAAQSAIRKFLLLKFVSPPFIKYSGCVDDVTSYLRVNPANRSNNPNLSPLKQLRF